MATDRKPLISQCPGKGFVLYFIPVGFTSFLLRKMTAAVMFEDLMSDVGPGPGHIAKNLETERL